MVMTILFSSENRQCVAGLKGNVCYCMFFFANVLTAFVCFNFFTFNSLNLIGDVEYLCAKYTYVLCTPVQGGPIKSKPFLKYH